MSATKIRTVGDLIRLLDDKFDRDALVCGTWEGIFRCVAAVDRAADGTAVIDVYPEGRATNEDEILANEPCRFEIDDEGRAHPNWEKP